MATRALPYLGLLGLLWIFGAQGSPSAQSLLAELKEKSASNGLVIAGVMDREFMVFPFAGSPFFRRFFNYHGGLARIAPDGEAILVLGLNDGAIPAQGFALINAEGRVIALLNRDVINVADFALASDRISIVFAGNDPATGQVGVYIARLGTADIRLIVPLESYRGAPAETSVTWVPDRSAVLFSRAGQVWRYDVASEGSSVLFPAATNPSCSPDGKWIAYRDSNGYAAVASRLGSGARRASRNPINGYIHWSPDSEYYFVDEMVPRSSPQRCPFGNCFVVYRLRDGSRLQLHGTDRKDAFFGWLQGPWPLK